MRRHLVDAKRKCARHRGERRKRGENELGAKSWGGKVPSPEVGGHGALPAKGKGYRGAGGRKNHPEPHVKREYGELQKKKIRNGTEERFSVTRSSGEEPALAQKKKG